MAKSTRSGQESTREWRCGQPTYPERVIFGASRVSADEFERATGWRVKAEGLCRDDRCVPFTSAELDTVELAAAAAALRMPLVHEPRHSLWALGARIGGHALESAIAPDLRLPDAGGRAFALSSLRGTKVLLVAWASW